MKIYGLYGKSGTGKSHHAMTLCQELGVDAIIDDGLFISRNVVLAGISAKRQNTIIGAVKTALFTDDGHCAQVREKIREEDPQGILVLGTSIEMVDKIRARLELPEVEKYIAIEDITTEKQRAEARRQRHELGKHVIPAPTMQIKRQFSGYFVDPLRLLQDLGLEKRKERSVVRPTYSYWGEYKISDTVINQIVEHVGEQTEGVVDVNRVVTESDQEGITLYLSAIIRYGRSVPKVAGQLQRDIRRQVEHITAFNIKAIHVDVRGLA
ncbi:MAG: Asp23/Gls24 family envelope stress response protein [Clostridiales bacterium]|nr:Asp23/Gls24 family envelope stress response protein [Clostridiales bacterium]